MSTNTGDVGVLARVKFTQVTSTDTGEHGQSAADGKFFRAVTESFSARCGKCFRT